jgi:hypothetical protein
MTTCDWPGSALDGTCGEPAVYEIEVDGKCRPLCVKHAENLGPHLETLFQVIPARIESEPPIADPDDHPAPDSHSDPVIDVMPVSESIPPESEEPAEVHLKNALLDLALAGAETLLGKLKTWRRR